MMVLLIMSFLKYCTVYSNNVLTCFAFGLKLTEEGQDLAANSLTSIPGSLLSGLPLMNLFSFIAFREYGSDLFRTFFSLAYFNSKPSMTLIFSQ
jgi:hypothetical protein